MKPELIIIKESLKQARQCLDRAAWYLKIPSGQEMPDGLKELAAVELMKAVIELAQAATFLLDRDVFELQEFHKNHERTENAGMGVNVPERKSDPVHIKEVLPGVMRDIANRIERNRGENGS